LDTPSYFRQEYEVKVTGNSLFQLPIQKIFTLKSVTKWNVGESFLKRLMIQLGKKCPAFTELFEVHHHAQESLSSYPIPSKWIPLRTLCLLYDPVISILQCVGIRVCIQKFPDWLPGASTVNGTALCH
jgi:hypothetical protein